ncbi:hypothetical protein COCNU_04G000390 [Cocos nucifera]|uniref:Uncharacterized protein n=1 Tax=Cocos nucifera TaxID=13894 RepID=A0A8K0I4B8_COCNU|nr:hypothetical protein COCNU_04G000390 [Cocos nucifera]
MVGGRQSRVTMTSDPPNPYLPLRRKIHLRVPLRPMRLDFSTRWGKPRLNWNSNKFDLLGDKEAFEELLGMKVSKLSQLVMDQSLFDSGISLFFPRMSLSTNEVRSLKTSGVAAPPRSGALVIHVLPISALPSPTSFLMPGGHRDSTRANCPPQKEPTTQLRLGLTAALRRPSLSTASIMASVRQSRPLKGPRVPLIDPPSTSVNRIDLAKASKRDILTLGKDLLYAVMPQHDLHARRRDMGSDEILNQGFSYLLDSAFFFRLYAEHIGWLAKNKKSLEEALQSMKDYQKAVEEKVAKEEKASKGLKKQ